jgi:hypothetical protein
VELRVEKPWELYRSNLHWVVDNAKEAGVSTEAVEEDNSLAGKEEVWAANNSISSYFPMYRLLVKYYSRIIAIIAKRINNSVRKKNVVGI